MKSFSILAFFVASIFSASTPNSDLQNIVAQTDKIDGKAGNSKVAALSTSSNQKYIISNLVAKSGSSLGKYSGSFHYGVSQYPTCKEGLMFCDYYSYGFWTCAQGRFVYRNCGPGTRCVQKYGNLYCDYA